MLSENIPCHAVLAMTATATKATEAAVTAALGIAPQAVFRDASVRANLRLDVTHINGGVRLRQPLMLFAGVASLSISMSKDPKFQTFCVRTSA